ncbi:UDP-N-acetylglucosamine transferase subunit ALG14-like protein [Cladobotryum mycophilum]|uniref:UDP-N-acetylglucosamine transferase subunit ALG14 n=1 Tax=Cladobotryum mycophilum TaxID=491253 RepID=A0ABR0T125_9HYPO
MGQAIIVLLGLAAALSSAVMAFLSSSLSWKRAILPGLASLICLGIFATTRHIQLIYRRCPKRQPKPYTSRDGGLDRNPVDYYLFVLGSGGHTREMLMMMDDGFCHFENFHRRYLISSGDAMSENHLEDYEKDLRLLCKQNNTSPGTYDKKIVTRARRVHQPLWSTPLTALLSILDILPALLNPPRNHKVSSGSSNSSGTLRYPSQIFSNGPATGFFVALAVHLLKMFYVVPEDCMKFIYIESWARISTLSLTGKLLYHTGIADVFVTQHEAVAAKYGVQDAGEVVFNSRRLDDVD